MCFCFVYNVLQTTITKSKLGNPYNEVKLAFSEKDVNWLRCINDITLLGEPFQALAWVILGLTLIQQNEKLN